VSERDGLFENRTAKIDSLKENFIDNIYITILLNYDVRHFFVRIWQPCCVWSVVCKQCLLKHAREYFADLFSYTD